MTSCELVEFDRCLEKMRQDNKTQESVDQSDIVNCPTVNFSIEF